MLKRSSAAVVLVTGCSSGIGKAICDQLATGGTTVYGGSRTPCTSSSVDASSSTSPSKAQWMELSQTCCGARHD